MLLNNVETNLKLYKMTILDYIKKAVAFIKRLVKKIVDGILNFARHIVGWFRGLHLNQQIHTPFVANANSAEFRKMLNQAPVRKVGIFQGVYNEETEEITHHEYISADGVDEQTYRTLNGQDLVVLQ